MYQRNEAGTINTNCERRRVHQEKTYTQKRRSACSHFRHFRSFNGFSVLRNLYYWPLDFFALRFFARVFISIFVNVPIARMQTFNLSELVIQKRETFIIF